MAIVKRFNLKGLATKIDDLYKKQEMATDCLNVYKDCSGRIEGRKGVLKFADVTCDDMYYSREKQKHYKFTNVMQESSDGATFSFVNSPFSGSLNQSIKSFAEMNGDIYFSDTELVDPVMKFNGYEVHQAGVPELFDSDVSITYSGMSTLSGDYYLGIAISCSAPNGDKFFGPLYQKKISLSNNLPVVSIPTIATINTARGTKYYDRYWDSVRGHTIVAGVITPTLGGATTNLVAGDYLKIAKISRDAQYIIKSVDIGYKKIKTVAAPVITLEDNTINSADGWVVLNDSNLFIDLAYYNRGKEFQRYEYVVFLSKTNNQDYRMFSNYDMFAKIGVSYGVLSDADLANRPSIDEYLDVTDSRVQPFKCKYLASYANMMLCLNVLDESSDRLSSAALSYSMFFSSSGEGSSPETFNYSNNIVIGTPDEGTIIGAGVVGNNIAVLKDRATHIITMNQYGDIGRIVKASATVGCASNKAILNYDNMLAWLSDKGVFALSKTGEPEELTEEIENLFTDNPYSLDFSKSRVAIDRFNEMILFYCPHTLVRANDITLSYSYKWKEWYLWKGINALNGFYHTGGTFFFNDGTKSYLINKNNNNDDTCDSSVLLFGDLPAAASNSGKVYLVQSTFELYKSNGSAWELQSVGKSPLSVERFYSSAWEHLGEPANEKKFNNLVVFSVQNPEYSYESWDVRVKSDYDWNTSNEVNIDEVKSFSSSNRRNFVNCDRTACYSRRFTFHNNTLNQGFSLSGYEFEVIMPQQRMRD